MKTKASFLTDPRLIVTDGQAFQLSTHETNYQGDITDEKKAEKRLKKANKRMAKLQQKLYATDHHSILLVFQAMDAAGKDSTIKAVFSGVNPTGFQVSSFKAPSKKELDHDYLWRTTKSIARTRTNWDIQPFTLRRGSRLQSTSGICHRTKYSRNRPCGSVGCGFLEWSV